MENERDFKGIWIPKEIWLSKELSLQEKVFLVEIDSLDNEEGCFAGNDHFANFFGLSKNRCSEIIKSLEKKGFIEIAYIRGENTRDIKKRIIKVLDFSKRYSENRQTYSEKCEENNTINNIFNKEEDKKQIPCQNDENFKKIVQAFNKYIHPINAKASEILIDFLDIKLVDYEIILKAIDEAARYNGRNINYIESILMDWIDKGLKTVDEIEAYKRERKVRRNYKPKEEGGNGSNGDSRSDSPKNDQYSKVKKLRLGAR